MAIIESNFDEVLNHGKVKRKGNKTRKLRATAQRVIGGASEVMVKITSYGKGAQHVKAHFDYITRNGNIEMENESGELFVGKKAVSELFDSWNPDFHKTNRRTNQRDTMHMVLSMPETVDSESVKNATRQFAKENFGKNHEYAFVLHTDTPQPHCHLTVKMEGFNGKRLDPRKADLQKWRDSFAEHLRFQGVDAEATPRASRGVIKKAVSNIIRHIEAGDKSHKPRTSKVKTAKLKESVKELLSESERSSLQRKPWEDRIENTQQKIRKAWLTAAELLEKERPKITFNKKEAHNEQPDYERIDSERARRGQRAAALYQSGLAKPGPRTSTGTISGMCKLSGIGLVQQQRTAEMLLRENARNRLGRRERTADFEMRWQGISDSGAPGSEGQLNSKAAIANDDKSLAASIRGFVAGMPSMETERHEIKLALIKKFTKQPDIIVKPQAETIGQKKGADHSTPEQKEKDIEI